MTIFRPCIDLHNGQVKQIVGKTLSDAEDAITENFVSDKPASYFAGLYAADDLTGGHVIKLGSGNDLAAANALNAYPDGLQIGGGISLANAESWLMLGARHVIVTSWMFDPDGTFQESRLRDLVQVIGRENIVVDLSCRVVENGWRVAMNRWQTLTDLPISIETFERLAEYADEFLIHAADVEGLCNGIDTSLVRLMGEWGGIPMTYAGGATSLDDLRLVENLSGGKVDLTIGSALDIFGGNGVRYAELVAFNRNLPPL